MVLAMKGPWYSSSATRTSIGFHEKKAKDTSRFKDHKEKKDL
jgi:hypothetical protein